MEKIKYPISLDMQTYLLLKHVAKLKNQSIKDCMETAIALLLKDNWTLLQESLETNTNNNNNTK